MLVVAAIELCHPMILIIQVESHDMTRKALHIAVASQSCLMPLFGSSQVTRSPLSYPNALSASKTIGPQSLRSTLEVSICGLAPDSGL
jgi:hypothetical protein